MGGRGLTLSINDTGVDEDHPMLEGISLIGSRDFTNSRKGTHDVDGHGTFVLSQIYRLLPNAKYLVAKVLGDNGSGSSMGIVAGDDWAAENGANAINESLGSSQPDRRKGDWLQSYDGLVFAASGNNGRGRIGYPANNGLEAGVIPCGAYGPKGDRADFSQWGERLLCLGAGVGIVGARSGGGQTTMSGTSMGTPDAFATAMGYISTLWGEGFGEITSVDAIIKLMQDTTTDILQPGRDKRTGFGRIERKNVIALIENLQKDSGF